MTTALDLVIKDTLKDNSALLHLLFFLLRQVEGAVHQTHLLVSRNISDQNLGGTSVVPALRVRD